MLARLAFTWAANLLGLFVAGRLDLLTYGDELGTLALAALVFALANTLLRPVAIILTLPAVVLTLGLFILLINAAMLWLTAEIVGGFELLGFWRTVGAVLVLTAANWLVGALLREGRKEG